MKRVNIADLKNNLSRHLSHVRTGGDIVVLDRNIPVARVIPFDRSAPAAAGKPRSPDTYWTAERLADLEQRGTIARGGAEAVATWLKAQRPIRLPKGAPSAVDLLLKQRRQSTR